MVPEPIVVLLHVTSILESLEVEYVVRGSMASTIYGRPRTTMDADLLADLRAKHIEPFTQALGKAYYFDAVAISAAIGRRSSFNLIHLETMFKVDIFIPKDRPFDKQQLGRGVRRIIASDPDRTAMIASAEDTILAKLEWFVMGGETSDRQWSDILGILEIQGTRLDQDYLHRWATIMNIADQLNRALAEANAS